MCALDSMSAKERGVVAAGPRPGHAAPHEVHGAAAGAGCSAIDAEALQQHPLALTFRSRWVGGRAVARRHPLLAQCTCGLPSPSNGLVC